MAGIDDVEQIESSSGDPSIKVVVVGDDSIGKSCFVTRYVNEEFDPFQPVTIGSYFLTKTVKHSGTVSKLQVSLLCLICICDRTQLVFIFLFLCLLCCLKRNAIVLLQFQPYLLNILGVIAIDSRKKFVYSCSFRDLLYFYFKN